MAQWIERRTLKQRVACSIPSQGTCLGCRPGPSRGHMRGNHTLMFLFLSFSLPSPLSKKINKLFKKIKNLFCLSGPVLQCCNLCQTSYVLERPCLSDLRSKQQCYVFAGTCSQPNPPFLAQLCYSLHAKIELLRL